MVRGLRRQDDAVDLTKPRQHEQPARAKETHSSQARRHTIVEVSQAVLSSLNSDLSRGTVTLSGRSNMLKLSCGNGEPLGSERYTHLEEQPTSTKRNSKCLHNDGLCHLLLQCQSLIVRCSQRDEKGRRLHLLKQLGHLVEPSITAKYLSSHDHSVDLNLFAPRTGRFGVVQ